jgi:hypothetical protein
MASKEVGIAEIRVVQGLTDRKVEGKKWRLMGRFERNIPSC